MKKINFIIGFIAFIAITISNFNVSFSPSKLTNLFLEDIYFKTADASETMIPWLKEKKEEKGWWESNYFFEKNLTEIVYKKNTTTSGSVGVSYKGIGIDISHWESKSQDDPVGSYTRCTDGWTTCDTRRNGFEAF